jgi:hypothetical protein
MVRIPAGRVHLLALEGAEAGNVRHGRLGEGASAGNQDPRRQRPLRSLESPQPGRVVPTRIPDLVAKAEMRRDAEALGAILQVLLNLPAR